MLNQQSQKIAEKLRDAGEKSVTFFAAILPEKWDQTIYTEGANWNIRQVLAHFVATESGFLQLIAHTITGSAQLPGDFDLNAYNEKKVDQLRGPTPEMLLGRFTELRTETVKMVAALDDSDLEKEGRHPFFGMAPVGSMLKLIYRHNQIHQRDIRKALEPANH
jgi:uncharacterized damage-inducible protein DinB